MLPRRLVHRVLCVTCHRFRLIITIQRYTRKDAFSSTITPVTSKSARFTTIFSKTSNIWQIWTFCNVYYNITCFLLLKQVAILFLVWEVEYNGYINVPVLSQEVGFKEGSSICAQWSWQRSQYFLPFVPHTNGQMIYWGQRLTQASKGDLTSKEVWWNTDNFCIFHF